MEALAALAIVANIFQVVDFSIKVLSAANDLRKAGTTRDQSDIYLVAEDLKNLNSKLTQSSQSISTLNNLSEHEVALERLSDRASAIAGDLTQLLDQHKVPPGASRLKSLAKAIRSTWDQKKIEAKTNQLESIRNELSTRILASIRTDLNDIVRRDIRNDDRLQKFDDATKKIVEAILDNRVIIRAELQVQSEELKSKLQISVKDAFQEFNVQAEQRHHEILNTMKCNCWDIPDASDLDRLHNLIQSSLNFHQLKDRYDDISIAHQSTFQWIFTNTDICSFAQWIASGRGIYWICGKAGSGKSTLMKMIDSDRRLREGLRLWADGCSLVTASFFFWRNGTEIQRSYHGLLRSLLLQVIQAQPELSPILFPHMYKAKSNWAAFPTLHDLKRAFQTLTTQDRIPLRIALLVDGLDEYESSDMTMDMLAAIFTDIAKSPNIKLILSGRPLRALEKAFECCDSLRLEHLTSKDISIYVNQQIREHPDLAAIARTQPNLANELVAEIVQAASGEGFQNRDTIQTLRRRLREIPTDIYKLFQHMLRQVPTRYRKRSAQIFQLHRTVLEPPKLPVPQQNSTKLSPPLQFRFLTALGLSFALPQPENDLSFASQPLSENDAKERIKDIEVQLKTHCAGLLEFRKKVPYYYDSMFSFDPEPDFAFDNPITYIHRTAADFLKEQDIWEQLSKGSEDFKVIDHLFQSWILQITRVSSPESGLMDIYTGPLYCELIQWAKLLDTSADGDSLSLFKKFDSAFHETFSSNRHWSDLFRDEGGRFSPWRDNFLSFLIRARLTNALAKELKDGGRDIIPKAGRPLLEYACMPGTVLPGRYEAIDPGIITLLLANKADPNDKQSGWTPFQTLLNYCLSPDTIRDDRRVVEEVGMMILHGANPNAFITYDITMSKINGKDDRLSVVAVLQCIAERQKKKDVEVKEEIEALIERVKERNGKNRRWIDLGNGNFELQSADEEKQIWHDVDGNFVPKKDGSAPKKIRRITKKIATSLSRLTLGISRRFSRA